MARIHLVMGDAGTGKSTYALSGEGQVDYYELDVGSAYRAMEAMNLPENKVNLHTYPPPLTNLIEPERTSTINPAVPISVHRLEGWRELFWQFIKDYLEGLKGPGYPVFDTETKMWLMTRQAFLQEVQESVSGEKERLNSLAYTEPNARYDQVITAAKSRGKDLIMIAHEKEVWEGDKPTGRFIHDGKKEAANLADITLRFKVVNKKPVAEIMKAGAGGMELVGRKLEEPTIPSVNAFLDAAIKLRKAGMPLPDSNDELLELAEAL